VISPLKALMTDQLCKCLHLCRVCWRVWFSTALRLTVKLAEAGLPAMALTGATPEAEKKALYAQLEGRTPLSLKLLFMAPE